MTGALGAFALIVVMVVGLYGLYINPPLDSGTAHRKDAQGFLEWLLPGYKAPKVIQQDNFSPYAGQVKIIAVVPKTEDKPAQVMLYRVGNNAVPLAGWMIRSTKGTQIIGLEGQSYTSPINVPVLNDMVNNRHDRLVLYDGQGKIVDQYAY